MRHIELIGLPAAGKSTLVEILQKGDFARDRVIVAPLKRAPATMAEKVSQRNRDITSVSRQLFWSPRKSREIWRASARFRQPSLALQVRMYLNCLRVVSVARSTRMRTSENSILILDQGIFQAIWSLALQVNFQSRDQFLQCSRDILSSLAKPELVILVDVPMEIARQRLANKPDLHGRLPKLLESDPGWMSRAQEILDGLWEIACDEPLIKTFRYTEGRVTLNDAELSITQLLNTGEPRVP